MKAEKLVPNVLFLQVLYNILDWPTKPHSKLIVIGTHFASASSCLLEYIC